MISIFLPLVCGCQLIGGVVCGLLAGWYTARTTALGEDAPLIVPGAWRGGLLGCILAALLCSSPFAFLPWEMWRGVLIFMAVTMGMTSLWAVPVGAISARLLHARRERDYVTEK